jgi:hypothetical protein
MTACASNLLRKPLTVSLDLPAAHNLDEHLLVIARQSVNRFKNLVEAHSR